MQLTQKKLESLVSKKSLLRYLRSLPPDTTFNMQDGCSCAYHGLLCARLSLDDDLVGAYVEEFMVGEDAMWVDGGSFSSRFQSEAMERQGNELSMTAAQLIALAEGMDG
jgi:hypothetical protein